MENNQEQPAPADPNEDRIAVSKAMNIDTFSGMEEHQGRIDRIVEWAKASGAKTSEEVVMRLNHLKNTMGRPSIHDVSVHISIAMDRIRKEQEEKRPRGKDGKFL